MNRLEAALTLIEAGGILRSDVHLPSLDFWLKAEPEKSPDVIVRGLGFFIPKQYRPSPPMKES